MKNIIIKISLGFGLAFILIAFLQQSKSVEVAPTQDMTLKSDDKKTQGPYRQIIVLDEGYRFKESKELFNGRFDPSMTYDPSGIGWMLYSSVGGGRKPFGPYIQTELASSQDHGQTWQWVQTVNRAYDDTFRKSNGEIQKGNWNYEVSSITYDESDPVNKWKLLAHKLFAPSERGYNDPAYS